MTSDAFGAAGQKPGIDGRAMSQLRNVGHGRPGRTRRLYRRLRLWGLIDSIRPLRQECGGARKALWKSRSEGDDIKVFSQDGDAKKPSHETNQGRQYDFDKNAVDGEKRLGAVPIKQIDNAISAETR